MKRFFDIVLASITFFLLSPLLIFIAFLVYLKLGYPIFFRQTRTGLNNRPFQIFKFRSMLDILDKNGDMLPDSQRLTNFGRIFRSTSLDELPNLINVIIGDMSLVGPRPLPVEYFHPYNVEHVLRHTVRPGLTGWAQINGRNSLKYNDKIKLDVWYVDNQSLLLDLKILFITIKKVFLREGISVNGEATTKQFKDNK